MEALFPNMTDELFGSITSNLHHSANTDLKISEYWCSIWNPIEMCISSENFSLHVPFTSYSIPVGLILPHAVNPLLDISGRKGTYS
jgi:hypothetical protein